MNKDARISFAYDSEYKDFLQKEARKDDRNLSSLIQLIIREWVDARRGTKREMPKPTKKVTRNVRKSPSK